MTRRTFVAAALWLLSGAAPALAAPTTGTVSGVVTGLETGLLLPQVSVTLRSVTLRSETQPFLEVRQTGADGAFTFDGVPPGLYSIEATQPGFRPSTVAPILVIPGQKLLEHVALERILPPRRPARTS